jgi:PTH1 family peptidyl-tRNA hydrolase
MRSPGPEGGERQVTVERVVVGLGNPGARYAQTRHNLGFRVLDSLARTSPHFRWEEECRSLTGRIEVEGIGVLLAKPMTYMNLSGEAARLLAQNHGVGPESFVVVLDDLNLPLGSIRVRARGSTGGHRGLESILQALASDEVVRVRLGIDEGSFAGEATEFVLSGFSSNREAAVEEMVGRAGEAVRTLLTAGVPKAMSLFNAPPRQKESMT